MSVAKFFSFAVAVTTLIVTDASAQQPSGFVRPINPGGYNQYPQYPNQPPYPHQNPNQFPNQPGHNHGQGFPGQRPPIVVQPPIVVRPPIVIPPMPQSYELNGFANRQGNQSGFHRIKLDINRTGPNTYCLDGYIRYANGSQQRIHADAVGVINRGVVDLNMGRLGYLKLRAVGRNLRTEMMGEVSLFGGLDGNGMVFDIDRD